MVKRVYLDSIGCRLNRSEIDGLARQLTDHGHRLVLNPAEANVIVLNTCAVTQEAERKSRQRASKLHRAAPAADLLLTGCLAALEPTQVARLPGVSHVADNRQKNDILSLLELDRPTAATLPIGMIPGGRTRAFVKVQDGCDNQCAYCVTTIARGPGSSRPPEQVLREIEALVTAGYQEVVLTGVNMGSYRWQADTLQQTDLAALVRSILSRTTVRRLRLSSVEPWDVNPGIIRLWQNPRVCRQLHLPLQSGSASVLRRMIRPISPEAYRQLAESALSAVTDLALTTDVIVGFPGESENEFEESLDLVREIPFSRLHVFGFSPRPGTVAARMDNHLAPQAVRERSQHMRALGRQKQDAFLRRFVGHTMDVLWESRVRSDDDPPAWRGHTDNYIAVTAQSPTPLHNRIRPTLLSHIVQGGMHGQVQG